MRFAAPGYLWLLLALPVLAALFVLLFRQRRRALEAFGDRPLIDRLTVSASTERRVIKAAFVLGSTFFLVLALARPQWGASLETVTRRGIDIIVAVDTSLSMLAEDVKPNRLTQARAAISSLLDLLEGDRVGLVAFAGTAYVACPLTLDYAAASMFVDVLDTELIPVKGTGIAAAIRKSTEAFRTEDRRYKVLILITDGEDHEGDVSGAVQAAAEAGVIIYSIGVGSPSGEPIPLRDGRGKMTGYKDDREQRKVTSRLGESTLEEIAIATGGRYYRSTAEGIELRRIYEEIAGMDRKTMSSRLQSAYEERYPIPLALALALLALEIAIGDRRSRQAPLAGRGERRATS
jgi:Ca-activated chloride channel family protein